MVRRWKTQFQGVWIYDFSCLEFTGFFFSQLSTCDSKLFFLTEVLKELGKRAPDSLVKTRFEDNGFATSSTSHGNSLTRSVGITHGTLASILQCCKRLEQFGQLCSFNLIVSYFANLCASIRLRLSKVLGSWVGSLLVGVLVSIIKLFFNVRESMGRFLKNKHTIYVM